MPYDHIPGGDARSFYEGLVRGHSAELFGMAYRLTGARDRAEDLVQESFLEAWRSLGSLRDRAAARAWLFQILRHVYARRRRQESRRPRTSGTLEHLDRAAEGGSPLEALVRHDELQRALGSIDPRFKEAFLMMFLEGLSAREIAERLSVPLGTVLSRIHRARTALRRALGPEDA